MVHVHDLRSTKEKKVQRCRNHMKGWEEGVKGSGSRKFRPPDSPTTFHSKKIELYLMKSWTFVIDPYHSVAMLSLGGIKSFVFARQASARCEFSARLTVQKQSFLFSCDSTWLPCDKALLSSSFVMFQTYHQNSFSLNFRGHAEIHWNSLAWLVFFHSKELQNKRIKNK